MKTNWPALRSGCLIYRELGRGLSSRCLRSRRSMLGRRRDGRSHLQRGDPEAATQHASVRVEGQGKLEARASAHAESRPAGAGLQRRTAGRTPDGSDAGVGGSGARRASRPVPQRCGSRGDRPDIKPRITRFRTKARRWWLRSSQPAVPVDCQCCDARAVSTSADNNRRRTCSSRAQKSVNRPPRFALPGELTQPSSSWHRSAGRNARTSRRSPTQASSCSRPPRQAGNAAATVAPRRRPPAGKYTGEPISVNLKDVDLRDFFRLIHEISGLNVVLDPAVKGTLTIVLDEVPWDQALDIVLQNNGLDKQLNGNVLRIATRDTLKKEAETAARPGKGPGRSGGTGDRDPRPQLRQSRNDERHLEEIPERARRYSFR